MPKFRMDLIGPFGLFTPTHTRIDVRSRKAVALLALLAMAPSGVRTRVWLQMQLWGSRGTEQAQSSLRRELTNLAALLEAHGGGTLLRREFQRIHLDLDNIDVDIHALSVAVDLNNVRNRGDFLEGLDLRDCEEFEEWLRGQRKHYAELFALPNQTEPARLFTTQEILGAALPDSSQFSSDRSPTVPPKPSLVVTPFTVVGPTKDNGWLGESLADQLGLMLTQFPQLFVVSSLAGMTLTMQGKLPAQIATELGVRYLLTGSIHLTAGGGQRVTVQLIDGSTSEQIWGRSFQSSLDDLFQIEEEIVLAVAPQIWTQIDLSERHRGRITPIREANAYALYWRANALFREWRRESTLEAILLTDELVAINGDCALSAALAGFCNGIAFAFNWTTDLQATRRKAILHFQNAIRMGQDNVEAIGYAVGTLIVIGGDMRIADQLVGHALSLLPAYQPTLFWGGWVDVALGNSARARDRFELSLRINPASGVKNHALTGVGLSWLMEGDFKRALAVLDPIADSAADLLLTQAALAIAAAGEGDRAKARAAADRVELLGGADVVTGILRSEAHRTMLRQGLAMARA